MSGQSERIKALAAFTRRQAASLQNRRACQANVATAREEIDELVRRAQFLDEHSKRLALPARAARV